MLTQKALSNQILAQKGAYLWPIKENRPRLYQDLQTLFAAPEQQPKPGFGKISADFQTTTQVNTGYGCIERPTLQTSWMMNDYVDWPGLGQVYRLERKFSWMRQGKVYKTSCETEYGLTSLTRAQASTAKLLQIRRQHW